MQHESGTGTVVSERVRMDICVVVVAVDFDTEGCSLRVKGRNAEENPYIKVIGSTTNRASYVRPAWPHSAAHGPQLGQHHTLDVELNRKLSVTKTEWDSVAVERIGQHL